MKLSSKQAIFWVFLSLFILASAVTYSLGQLNLSAPYAPKDNLIAFVFPVIGMVIFQLLFVCIVFRKKIDWKQKYSPITTPIFIPIIVCGGSLYLLASYCQGIDHSTIKSYDSVLEYNTQNKERVIQLRRVDLNFDGISARPIVTTTYGPRHFRYTRHDTVTYFAMPIIDKAQNGATVGWLLSDIAHSDFRAMVNSQDYSKLVDFSQVEGFCPIDLSDDKFCSKIVQLSRLYDAQSATLPAFYASYQIPSNTGYFLWYTIGAYIITIFGLGLSAKLIYQAAE